MTLLALQRLSHGCEPQRPTRGPGGRQPALLGEDRHSWPTQAGPRSVTSGLSGTVATTSTISPHPGHLLRE